MMTMWRRIGEYLGLVEEYDDEYFDLPEDAPVERERETVPRREPAERSEWPETTNVRRIAPGPAQEPEEPSLQKVQNQSQGTSAKVHLTEPTTFNQVEEVGDKFRNGIPVIMNLAGSSEATAKRLLDFASGLIYGLDGRIERVGERVFLLTPVGVDVSSEERRRLSERGFFNQS